MQQLPTSGGLLPGLMRNASKASRDAPIGEPRDPDRIVPPMLYIPTRELADGGRLAIIVATEAGRHALLAYTALDRLAKMCGTEQPWVVVPTVELEEIQAAQPFDLVAFDAEVPASMLGGGRIA